MDIQNTVHVNSAFTYAQKKAISYRHEFITPEHLLSAFLEQSPFANALNMCFCDTQELAFSLENYFTEELESVPAVSAKHAPAQGLLGMPYPERSS